MYDTNNCGEPLLYHSIHLEVYMSPFVAVIPTPNPLGWEVCMVEFSDPSHSRTHWGGTLLQYPETSYSHLAVNIWETSTYTGFYTAENSPTRIIFHFWWGIVLQQIGLKTYRWVEFRPFLGTLLWWTFFKHGSHENLARRSKVMTPRRHPPKSTTAPWNPKVGCP